jgi:PHS family inorganic phosphate transporter-like MFS transporter
MVIAVWASTSQPSSEVVSAWYSLAIWQTVFGRKRLYGVELVVVIAATLGLTQASAGYDNKLMSVYGWICFWRTLLGIGVGAEYPLSALIASEWSSTKHRGTMLVAVFLMQPLSQLTAQGIGLGALRGISASHNLSRDEKTHEVAAPVIDSVWRLVIGVGAAPALLAIIGRMTIPETPRFLLEIERDASAALQSTTEVYSGSTPGSTTTINTAASLQERNRPTFTASESNSREDSAGPSSHKEFYGPARATTEQIPSFCWFLLDICYYGLGLDNPNLLGKIWLEKSPSDEGSYNATRPYDWNSNSLSHKDTQAIYRVLEGNFLRALYTTAPASVCGCLLFLLIVNRVPRVRFMVCIFMMLAAIFAILGGTLFSVYATNHHDVIVVFYAISLFLINLGPNTITFLLPAELFGTKNRGTCYGIAAASGKLGAIVVQIVIWRIRAGGTEKEPLAGLLLAFTPLMLLGALTAWVWIPEVQDPIENKAGQIKQFSVFSNRPLEKIAKNVTLDQVVRIRNKLGHLVRKKTE